MFILINPDNYVLIRISESCIPVVNNKGDYIECEEEKATGYLLADSYIYPKSLPVKMFEVDNIPDNIVPYKYLYVEDQFVVNSNYEEPKYDTGIGEDFEKILNNKMDKEDPLGINSFSMNRKSNTNIGDYSIAIGYNTTSSGYTSYAEGLDTTSSSDCSHAEGYNTIASGGYSHAEGYSTTASGGSSHAEGNKTIAQAQYSHAEGYGTSANGEDSHAEGYATIAGGNHSHAEGYNTRANGFVAHVEGFNTSATDYGHAEGSGTRVEEDYGHAEGSGSVTKAQYAHAEGNETIASGLGSHSEGKYSTASGNYTHAEGQSTTASGEDSHSEGKYSTASGNHSHAEGQSTTASGEDSHAEGRNTIAFGQNSHAEGYDTLALGEHSHAEGSGTYQTVKISGEANVTTYTVSNWETNIIIVGRIANYKDTYVKITAIDETNLTFTVDKTLSSTTLSNTNIKIYYGNIAYSYNSHAEGRNTIAFGQNSHAEGAGTIASGLMSHAEGYNTFAMSDYQHVQGKYNAADTTNTYAHIVGGGTSNTDRKNIHTLDWEGNAYFLGNMTIDGNITGMHTTLETLTINGNNGLYSVLFSSNGDIIMSCDCLFVGTDTKFCMRPGLFTSYNASDGNPYYFDSNADARFNNIEYKDNEYWHNALMNVKPCTYNYIQGNDKSTKIGVIAEDLVDHFPELVVKNSDGECETVSYIDFIIPIISELQRVNSINEEQQNTINKLQETVNELKSIIESNKS